MQTLKPQRTSMIKQLPPLEQQPEDQEDKPKTDYEQRNLDKLKEMQE